MYVLYYEEILPHKEDKVDDLLVVFTNVHIPEALTREQAAALTADGFNIKVVADAVQTENVGDNVYEAFETVGLGIDGVTAVSSYEQLVAALEVGGKIVLIDDITVDVDSMNTDAASIPVALAVLNDTELYLNGHAITVPDAEGSTAAIFVHDADLTIVGEGSVIQNGTSDYVVWAKGDATVDIKGGSYYAAGAETTLLYASGNIAWSTTDPWATINVYGGTFTNGQSSDDAQDYMNVMNHGVGRINLYGGTYDFDPGWMKTSWPNGVDDAKYITIAEGYTVVEDEDNGTYSIVAE